jgi:parvulin-like peptidyl-prolyl isomerase
MPQPRPRAVPFVWISACVLACASPAWPGTEPPTPAELATDLLEREGRAALAAGDPALRKTIDEQRRAILASAVEKERVEAATWCSDEDVRRYYDEHRSEFDHPEMLQLRHIFKRVSRTASPEEREKVRLEVQKLRDRLVAGEEFGKLAQENSDSETAGHGGQILPAARGGLPPSIEAVVWALKPGQLSDIVATPVGFHVFRLEAVLPAKKIPLDEARESIRRKRKAALEAEARESLLQDLLRRSAAIYDPAALRKRPLQGDPLLFALGPVRVTLRDVVAEWKTLPFARQRLESLEDVLRERVRRDLYAWEAARTDRARGADIAAALAAAEKQALIDGAFNRRLTARLRGPRDADVQAWFKEHRALFKRAARYRMRILARRFPDDRVPYSAYEELLALAGQIRGGARDFAQAAREISDDPSALEGGDLGWVDLYEFAFWAGFNAGNNLALLTPGTVSDPMLIEVYQRERLVSRRDGYMLVLVEETEPAGRARSLDDVRERVERYFTERNEAELRAEIEAELLAGK